MEAEHDDELDPEETDGRLDNNFLTKAFEGLKKSPAWNEKIVNGFWGRLPEADRIKLYSNGSMFKAMLINAGGVASTTATNVLFYSDPKLKAIGSYIAPSARALVQLDLLTAPGGLTSEKLIEDGKKDNRDMKIILWGIQGLLTVLAPECIPEFMKAKAIIIAAMEAKTKSVKDIQGKKTDGGDALELKAA
ncbi:MAG: hypothetical protein WCT36_00910 [Candidatus Gracilibacteria bacterium]